MDDANPSDGGFWSVLKNLFRHKDGQSLEEYIEEALNEGELNKNDVTMLLNVLRLGSKTIYETMVPRTDIVCADIEDSPESVCRLIIEHGHSRIPIYKTDKDNIVGIVHAKDLLKDLLEPHTESVVLADLMRKPLFVPENKLVRDMLVEFQAKKIHLAIALDEYGGTSGLVTLEDVLEEIVGEIEDEYDIETPKEFERMEDGSYRVSGRLSLHELNEELDLSLDSEQVETIGGYLCELTGRVPAQDEIFTLDGHRFTVTEADKKKIRWIHVQPADAA